MQVTKEDSLLFILDIYVSIISITKCNYFGQFVITVRALSFFFVFYFVFFFRFFVCLFGFFLYKRLDSIESH
jgi:hypothetical protein